MASCEISVSEAAVEASSLDLALDTPRMAPWEYRGRCL